MKLRDLPDRDFKITVYFPPAMMAEIRAEAKRLDRSVSWIIQRAWLGSRADVGRLMSVEHLIGARP